MNFIILFLVLIMIKAENNKRQKNSISKRDLQAINKLNYYLEYLFPSIFSAQRYPTNKYCSLKTNYIQNTYNYLHQLLIWPELLGQDTFIQLIKSIYFEGNTVNVGKNSYIKETQIKSSILSIRKKLRQNIVIITLNQLIQMDDNKKYDIRSPINQSSMNNNKLSLLKRKSVPVLATRSQPSLGGYLLYIIHYCIPSEQEPQLRWEHFVQSFRVSFESAEGKVKSTISYQVSFSYQYKPIFTLIAKYMNFLQLYYQQSIFTSKQKISLKNVEKIVDQLKIMNQSKRIKEINNKNNPSFDEIHRRQLRLDNMQAKLFKSMRPKTFAYFSSINKQRGLNIFFLQNLICRMMQNNDYKPEQSWQAIKYYLDFEKRIRSKYQWADFQKYQDMNLFTYIGKDMMGRPVLWNILRNALCSKIENFIEFFDYHFYLFEIYIQDQMQGWVDQFIVIADASNQVSDNTNLAFTKRIITQALKLTVGRIFRVFAFDVNFIGYTLYRILYPFIPNKIIETFKIFGDNKQQLLKQIRLYLKNDIIPSSIGGRNKIDFDNLKKGKIKTDLPVNTPLRRLKSWDKL